MSESPDAAPVPRRRFEWVRAATDRVPTRWFAGIATAAFLAATAAFGGLATAAPPELERLEPGEAHVTDQRSFTVQRAVLIDELSDAGVDVEEGERVLALIADVENTWTQPVSATGIYGVAHSFSIPGIERGSRDASARLDDGTWTPFLQPGVPATVVFAWPVDADRFSETDSIEVTLYDTTLITGSVVLDEQWWDNHVAHSVVRVEVEDLGAGADAEG
ncbi:hypothetical protein K0817_004535 [Microbacterium sp. HD4P20]|uniref:hypothetical protein n=1 Tax=Microbacterium sp. HD4P20 TaxID=2864874 RepID=UPI0020A2856B|nr:hypothetical protein [Microbacterium sp. HD4P20]MCP2635834.1 hypothetical protein [Microbacterium sp. HD4P20]